MAGTGCFPLTRLAESHPGQTLRVNIDPRVQSLCAAAAGETLANLAPSHIQAVAVVALDTPSGKCLASLSLATATSGAGAVDLTQCPRSSGSTLKPFIYAAAFDLGICTPRTMLDDGPGDWSGYEPANFDRGFRGTMPAGEALAQSRNLPAIALLWRVGVDREVELMRAAGFSTLRAPPIDMACRWRLAARRSRRWSWLRRMRRWVRRATPGGDAALRRGIGEGGSLHRALEKLLPGPAMWPATCRATLNCLADPDRTARICPSAASIGPAWKTGTSSGRRDAWCAAVTPRITVVVWVGNPDGSGADRLVGAEAAAPLALKIIAGSDPVQAAGFAPAIPRINLAAAAPIAVQPRPTTIQLISPADGQQIVRDPSIPGRAQRCPLQARESDASEAAAFWWFVDGRYIGQGGEDTPLWWSPSPGPHEVRVVDATGHAASAQVAVR